MQIISSFSKYKVDKLLLNSNFLAPIRLYHKITWHGSKSKPSSKGVALRLLAEELGPIFIKLGQAISVRKDLFADDITKELSKLQDKVPAFSSEQAMKVIEQELGDKISNKFSYFCQQPFACASIAQVHRATTLSGEDVVVKILRPNIQQLLKQDIQLMRWLVKIVQYFFGSLERYRLWQVIDTFEQTFLNEVDFSREAANAASLRRNFIDSADLYVPKVYWQLSTKRILVSEYVNGIPISDMEKLHQHQVNIKKLATKGVNLFFTQVFQHRFFHADMHPGNIFVDYTNPDNPKYIAVDFGIMGAMSVDDQHCLANIFMAFFARDFVTVAKLHQQAGWVAYDIDVLQFAEEIRIITEPIFDKPLQDISFGKLLIHLLQVSRQFSMEIQPQLLLFQKTLFAVEGLGKNLYPQLNFWDIAKPFFLNWRNEQLQPKVDVVKDIYTLKKQLQGLLSLPELMHNSLKIYNRTILQKKMPAQPVYKRHLKWFTIIAGGFLCAIWLLV